MYSVNLKKDSVSLLRRSSYEGRQRIYTSNFDSAESFDPEFFNYESFDLELTTERLTTEGLVAGCGSLVIKSIKRSLRLVGVVAPTPRRASSIFNVRCWTFDVRRSRLLVRLWRIHCSGQAESHTKFHIRCMGNKVKPLAAEEAQAA